ncbi:hypothetical protein C1707_08450 [Caulobacter flavus]|uniref:Uncharacterized protein n=1 Tax=Caulobacter flavus TaxID=1679497 RepID=A0ABN5QKX1_9CAUL|nr:hypothetical protein C1707_08450 [Caulobacter flavus]
MRTASLLELARGLPPLFPTYASDRWLSNLTFGAGISLLVGLGAVAASKYLPASFIWVGWAGLVLYVAGGVAMAVHTVLSGGTIVLRMSNPEPAMLAQLDAAWTQEWTTVQHMAPGRWDALAARARWVKTQAQLLDRSTSRTAILGLIFTSAASLLAPTLTGEKLAALRDIVQTAPIALAAGMAVPALVHHILAGRLLRIEWMLSEAAIGAKALAEHAKVAPEPPPAQLPRRTNAKRKSAAPTAK